MDKNLFEQEMIRARARTTEDSDYWTGYERGLRRRHHGETSGTDEVHGLWMALANEPHDMTRRQRGLGYRAGYLGPHLSMDHSASRYGIPVIVHAGEHMDYAAGIRLIRKWRGWSCADLAERIQVSPRTVEGWEQGRMPSAEALLKVKYATDQED